MLTRGLYVFRQWPGKRNIPEPSCWKNFVINGLIKPSWCQRNIKSDWVWEKHGFRVPLQRLYIYFMCFESKYRLIQFCKKGNCSSIYILEYKWMKINPDSVQKSTLALEITPWIGRPRLRSALVAHAGFADTLLRVLLCMGSTSTRCWQFLDGHFRVKVLEALFFNQRPTVEAEVPIHQCSSHRKALFKAWQC